jgi:hypothetical protein
MAGCRVRAWALLAALLAALIATGDASTLRVFGTTSGQAPKPQLPRVNATLPVFGNGGLAAFLAAHTPKNGGATPSTPAPGFNFSAIGQAMQQRVISAAIADVEKSACVGHAIPNRDPTVCVLTALPGHPGVKNTPLEPLVNALAPLLNSTAFINVANSMFSALIQGQSQPGGVNITTLLHG